MRSCYGVTRETVMLYSELGRRGGYSLINLAMMTNGEVVGIK